MAWTQAEDELILSLDETHSPTQMASQVPGKNADAIRKRLNKLLTGSQNKSPEFDRRVKEPNLIHEAELHGGGVIRDDKAHILDLEAKLARLQAQVTWAQECSATERTGGTLTLRASDHHYGDKNHLISCGNSLTQKFLTLVEQYQPAKIQLVQGDDWVAGRGIYREQDLDCVTGDTNEQIMLGAWKARLFLIELRKITQAPVTWYLGRGNHDFANGHSTTEYFFGLMRELVEDIEGVSIVQYHDRIVVNAAHEGVYNLLVKHGYGYSEQSPNSPRFVADVLKELLVMARRMQPEAIPWRIVSGHTHWLDVGLERCEGLFFDTTGGLQRHNRVRLGTNQRPIGWIVYVGLPGAKDSILQPIAIKPDTEVYLREVADPELGSLNLIDAGTTLRAAHAFRSAKGTIRNDEGDGVLSKGRW